MRDRSEHAALCAGDARALGAFAHTIKGSVGNVGATRLAGLTHDIEMDWMLPGIPPTGRYVEIPLVAIVLPGSENDPPIGVSAAETRCAFVALVFQSGPATRYSPLALSRFVAPYTQSSSITGV